MIASLKDVLARAESWPPEAQKELADMALEMESLVNARLYRASAEELRAIDEAEASGTASEAEIEAAFAAFRRG